MATKFAAENLWVAQYGIDGTAAHLVHAKKAVPLMESIEKNGVNSSKTNMLRREIEPLCKSKNRFASLSVKQPLTDGLTSRELCRKCESHIL